MHADGCLIESPFLLQCHETCENVARNEKKARERQIWGCHFGCSITHPLKSVNEVLFSAFFGFTFPGARVGSDKNTVSGVALFPAVRGVLGSLSWSPFCHFLGGGGARGGLCQMEKHKKQQQKQQSEEEEEEGKKKKSHKKKKKKETKTKE